MNFFSSIEYKTVKQKLNHVVPSHMWETLKNYEMLDWFYFFDTFSMDSFEEKVENIALDSIDFIICIGVGGSYQGIESIADFLGQKEKWIFLGPSFDVIELQSIKNRIQNKNIMVNIISKTGTTFENLFFIDFLRQNIKDSYQINVITSNLLFYKAVAKDFGEKKTYFFKIEEKTGGRFSLFGEMGLLTLFLCHANYKNIGKLIQEEKKKFEDHFFEHPAFYRGGSRFLAQTEYNCVIEFLSTAKKSVISTLKWVRQLTAESDGKKEKGLYVGLNFYPEDAHCVGQILREGKRVVAETFYKVEKQEVDLSLDNFDYSRTKINSLVKAQEAFLEAVIEDRIESRVITGVFILQEVNSEELFKLFFCEMLAISLEGYLLGINPYNQPGVESYKNKMSQKFF